MDTKSIKKEGYCYIDDVLEKKFDPKEYSFEEDNYDPDRNSKALYKDMATVFCGTVNGNEIKVIKLRKGGALRLEVVVNKGEKDEKKFICSTDYIGPSCNWAHNKIIGLTDKEIGDSLLAGRVLGGHMFWPTEDSINQGRGNRPLYDRIDLCLKVISEYFNGEEKSNCCTGLFNRINANGEWFNIFGQGPEGFKNFIDYFRLRDFVTEEYEVISLSISDIEAGHILTVDKENKSIYKNKVNSENCYLPGKQFNCRLSDEEIKCKYRKFMQNNLELIKLREKRMHDLKE